MPKGASGNCLLVLKSIYGLRDAGARFAALFKAKLESMDFEQCKDELCVYRWMDESDEVGFLAGHFVDDVIALGPDDHPFWIELEKEYGVIVDLEARKMIGMYMVHSVNLRHVYLMMSEYKMEYVTRIGMVNAKTVDTPFPIDAKLGKNEVTDAEMAEVRNFPFLVFLGMANWIAQSLHVELIGPLSIISSSQPFGPEHKRCLEHMGKYLHGKQYFGLRLGSSEGDRKLVVYCDAAFPSCYPSSKCRAGIIVGKGLISDDGFSVVEMSTLTTTSKVQTMPSASVVQAEYQVLLPAAKQVLWARKLERFIGNPQAPGTPIYCDSSGAISLVTHEKLNKETRHIANRFHFARAHKARGDLDIIKIPTDVNAADQPTKPLAQPKADKFLAHFGIVDVAEIMKKEKIEGLSLVQRHNEYEKSDHYRAVQAKVAREVALAKSYPDYAEEDCFVYDPREIGDGYAIVHGASRNRGGVLSTRRLSAKEYRDRWTS